MLHVICLLLLPMRLFPLIILLFLVVVFSAQRSSFRIRCKAGLVVLSFLSFYLSVKLLVSPLNLNESLAGQSILGYRFFPSITVHILHHSLLAYKASAEKSADNLMGIPIYVTCPLLLLMFYFCLFEKNYCLGVFLLGVFLPATLLSGVG